MPSSPRFDPSSLGNLALATGKVTRETMREVTAQQVERPGVRVGELLVEAGALTEKERDALLAKQERMRSGKPTSDDVLSMADYAVQCLERAADKLDKLNR